MAGTQRLHYDDPLLCDFDAVVEDRVEIAGRIGVVLDRTAFYPESGGQMADHGKLGRADVTDVQATKSGIVQHFVDGGAPQPGEHVHGAVDRERRRLHMALHTGQHVLSRAFVEVANAETVSSRLGERVCTLDLDRPALDERLIEEAENLTNSVVDDDREVRAFFPTPDELAALPLRRPPPKTNAVRVVQIADFDATPCGGTHCLRTAEVGLVKVVGLQRHKGGVRVSFQAGRRARDQLFAESQLLRELGAALTCAPSAVPSAVERLKKDLDDARGGLAALRRREADRVSADLLAGGSSAPLVAVLDGLGLDEARAVAGRIATVPEAVALVAARSPDGLHVVARRGEASSFDCGAFVRGAAEASGGRGGGRAERAEGRLPPGTDWERLARTLLD